MLGEEVFRPGAEGSPLVPAAPRSTVFQPLVQGNRHDSELVVRLQQYLLGHEKLRRAVEEPGGTEDHDAAPRRAVIARGPGAVLNGERVKSSVPLQPLMAKAESV